MGNSTYEDQLCLELRKHGYTVLRKGWPDALVVDENTNKVLAVEIKTGSDRISKEQREMHRWLSSIGVTTTVLRDPVLTELPNLLNPRMLSASPGVSISGEYLTDNQVAALLSVSVASLRNDRSQRRGLPYVKLRKTVRYLLSDVVHYMNSHRIEMEK